MRKFALIFAIVASLIVPLVGCSSSGGDEGTPSGPPGKSDPTKPTSKENPGSGTQESAQ